MRRRDSRVEVAKAPPPGPTARPGESSLVSSVPEHESFASRRSARIDFDCNVSFAMAALGVAVALLWPTPNRHPPAPIITSTLAPAELVPVRAAPVEPQGAPVRIKNAFDAMEVFEFPHGTSESEAREAVGELLLSRARDRRAQGLALKRVRSLQPVHAGAVQRPEVFVTRLLAPRERTLNGAN